jgi:hypothetical protein
MTELDQIRQIKSTLEVASHLLSYMASEHSISTLSDVSTLLDSQQAGLTLLIADLELQHQQPRAEAPLSKPPTE